MTLVVNMLSIFCIDFVCIVVTCFAIHRSTAEKIGEIMKKLHEKSRAIIEFELEWQSKDARHIDGYWADPVNFWRDCLDQSLYTSLMGKEENGKVTVEIPKKS